MGFLERKWSAIWIKEGIFKSGQRSLFKCFRNIGGWFLDKQKMSCRIG
jgi:hypothetical protein